MNLPEPTAAPPTSGKAQEEMALILDELEKRRKKCPLDFYKPNPFQSQLHQSPFRNRLCLSGNKAGKSIGVSADIAMLYEDRHPTRKLRRPSVGWIVAKNFDAQR